VGSVFSVVKKALGNHSPQSAQRAQRDCSNYKKPSGGFSVGSVFSVVKKALGNHSPQSAQRTQRNRSNYEKPSGGFSVVNIPPHMRGLLYKEWLAHRNLIVGFWAVWLVCGPVLMLFHHPAWIFALGLLYAILVAPAVAGMDAAEGSEEFAFSLPPTRSEVFLTRLALAGGNLLALLAVPLLVMWLNLAQLLWGLVAQSGFTEPFFDGGWWAVWTWLALSVPVGVFAASFALAALARSRGGVGFAWLGGTVLTGAVFGLVSLAHVIVTRVFFREDLGGGVTAERFHVWIPCLAVVLFAGLGLFLGYVLYLRKEGISRPAPAGGRRSALWVIVVVIVVLLALLLFLVPLGAKLVPVPEKSHSSPLHSSEKPVSGPAGGNAPEAGGNAPAAGATREEEGN